MVQDKPKKTSPFTSCNFEGVLLELVMNSTLVDDEFDMQVQQQPIDYGVSISTIMAMLEQGDLDGVHQPDNPNTP